MPSTRFADLSYHLKVALAPPGDTKAVSKMK